MAVLHLPENPDIDQLRRQARELQRRVRAGDISSGEVVDDEIENAGPDFPLAKAQLAVARRYGFASWPRLRRHVDAIRARSWTFVDAEDADDAAADRIVGLACLTYSGADGDPQRAAQARALAADRRAASSSLAAAVVLGDVGVVRDRLVGDPSAAFAPTGPRDWSPLMYLAYARLDVAGSDPIGVARLLLDAGADPNDGRFFGGFATPFTVLTGVLGGGEEDQPPHPQALPLARLLLERGAEANDAQALYNRQFGEDDTAFELLFEFGLGRGDGGPWLRLLPDLLVGPRRLLRRLMRWAVVHDQRARVAMLVAHGVDVDAGMGAGGPLQVALRNGHLELADLLRELGATEPRLGAGESFIAAALAGDRARADAVPAEVVDRVRARRTGLLVWAAGLGRPSAVELLLEHGWDVDGLGRSDVPRDEPWQTALHSAVAAGDERSVTLLLARGADPTIRDARFDGTAADWAQHFGHGGIGALLARQA